MELSQISHKCEEVACLFKHFAHPQRLLILCFLSQGEKQVSQIHQAVGISQSQTSQFLRRMQSEGILSLRREKNHTYYKIKNPVVLKLIKAIKKIFC